MRFRPGSQSHRHPVEPFPCSDGISSSPPPFSGRSIVLSSDTTRSNPLIALAQNADVVVHEVMIPSAVDRLIANVPNAPDLKRSTLSHHISAGDAGRVAPAAGVKTLVLSHLIPAEDPAVPESARIEAARQHFGGTIVVGRDLMEIQALGATPPRHARSAYRRRCPPPRRLMMIGREMTVE